MGFWGGETHTISGSFLKSGACPQRKSRVSTRVFCLLIWFVVLQQIPDIVCVEVNGRDVTLRPKYRRHIVVR